MYYIYGGYGVYGYHKKQRLHLSTWTTARTAPFKKEQVFRNFLYVKMIIYTMKDIYT